MPAFRSEGHSLSQQPCDALRTTFAPAVRLSTLPSPHLKGFSPGFGFEECDSLLLFFIVETAQFKRPFPALLVSVTSYGLAFQSVRSATTLLSFVSRIVMSSGSDLPLTTLTFKTAGCAGGFGAAASSRNSALVISTTKSVKWCAATSGLSIMPTPFSTETVFLGSIVTSQQYSVGLWVDPMQPLRRIFFLRSLFAKVARNLLSDVEYFLFSTLNEVQALPLHDACAICGDALKATVIVIINPSFPFIDTAPTVRRCRVEISLNISH